LAALEQKVGKGIRFRSEIADAEWARQRSRVKQDAAGSGKVHIYSCKGHTSVLSKRSLDDLVDHNSSNDERYRALSWNDQSCLTVRDVRL
jgi:hypothetical protein